MTKIEKVQTISGAAGGNSRVPIVNLRIFGLSDTVEDIRAKVEKACAMHEWLMSEVINNRKFNGEIGATTQEIEAEFFLQKVD